MAEELFHAFPFINHPPVDRLTPAAELTAPSGQEQVPASPEDARAVDHVFAEDRQAAAVAGLLGAWSSAMLLSDLAREHFSEPADDEKPRPRLPEPPREDPAD